MTYEPKQRTLSQNNAIHLFCTQLAEALNLAGLEMKLVLKPDYQIWWTGESVKTCLWKPLQKAKLGKESTTELAKLGEIDLVHEDLMRILGEKFGLEYIPFPNDPTKSQDYKSEARKLKIEYPEEELGEPLI